jgi:two-component system, OmpR family, phosphate regulon sensor histidine kinase PhoR
MVSPTLANLTSLLEASIKEIQPKIVEKKIVLDFHSDALPEMNLDANLTQIICHNLLTNAVKYSPDNSEIRVSLRKVAAGSELQVGSVSQTAGVLLEVADQGLGIPQAEQDKLFNKLFRATNATRSQKEGTGLGLYIVKKIVEEVGGRVWFVSKENEGATFYVWLPAAGMMKKEGEKKLD